MGKNIVVGVCGSIAAYKSAGIVRELKQRHWDVQVILTKEATYFITPLTLSVLSGRPVYTEMFEIDNFKEDHISVSEFADIILVAPATANIIGKIASGICDDLLTCVIFAFKGPVIFAPAMNENMWTNPIVEENVEKLKKNGYYIIPPEKGFLASGKVGIGRLAEISKIISFVEEKTKEK
ncbi:MAG: phosphopantothenoylcysteine decarboxylase [Candidatus Omnitrophica bacterium]|nr:phosphopantothenoylcysteine decarboxylase [Candidatus Omnitrophota bacterium]MCM8777702.1 phosphopantothenoylcysteine decarboxylase [Candidatus Omnitrophota bacterium]